MAYGNNRKGKQPRAHFQLAGGSNIKFRHPYLAGQIESGSGSVIDEIDISNKAIKTLSDKDKKQNRIAFGDEMAEELTALEGKVKSLGYNVKDFGFEEATNSLVNFV